MHETRGFRWLRRIGLTLLTVLVLAPLYVMLSTSIKPLTDVQQAFRWIPSRVTASPYRDMWNTVSLAEYFRNSLIVSTVATVLAVTIAIFAAYPLARLRFRGGRAFSIVVLSTQMFPGILFLLPLFLLYRQIQTATGIQLIGTYTGLIITYLTFSLPFSIWMLVGYLASLPRELEEAALVDGTGKIGALLRVVLPVARPGVIAVAVFAFMTAWGEVLFASVLTSDSTRTLAVGLQGYSQRQDVLWNQLMAAAVVVSLPVVLGFLAIQRFLVRGLSAGAVK
jgi:multiple sugar transport system permease protein